jgi:hypothetical protein
MHSSNFEQQSIRKRALCAALAMAAFCGAPALAIAAGASGGATGVSGFTSQESGAGTAGAVNGGTFGDATQTTPGSAAVPPNATSSPNSMVHPHPMTPNGASSPSGAPATGQSGSGGY